MLGARSKKAFARGEKGARARPEIRQSTQFQPGKITSPENADIFLLSTKISSKYVIRIARYRVKREVAFKCQMLPQGTQGSRCPTG